MITVNPNFIGNSGEDFFKKNPELQKYSDGTNVQKEWELLSSIYSNYCQNHAQFEKEMTNILQKLLERFFDKADPYLLHSHRARCKTPESLIVKILKKRHKLAHDPQHEIKDIEKYRDITVDNYHKILTDLIGIRVLVRYKYQLYEAHNIFRVWFRSDEGCVNDPLDQENYRLLEQSKVWYREDDEYDLYRAFGDKNLQIEKSREGYSSIHYVIYYEGKSCEIQLRTLFDETWGEANHDLIYKASTNIENQIIVNKLSRILSEHLVNAEKIATLMCDLCGHKCPSTETEERKKIAYVHEHDNEASQGFNINFDFGRNLNDEDNPRDFNENIFSFNDKLVDKERE